MLASIAPTFFVFPLPGAVLFPFTTKPLNIFEPRLIKMINDALEDETQIALALSDLGGLRIYSPDRYMPRPIGGLSPFEPFGGMSTMIHNIAGVGKPVIIDRREDESMLIVLEGTGKVRLGQSLATDEPYLVHQGEWMKEDNDLLEENLFLLNRMHKDFMRWLKLNVDDQERLALFLSQIHTPEDKINYMCALMVHDPASQQELLEIDCIDDRLHVLQMILDEQNNARAKGAVSAHSYSL